MDEEEDFGGRGDETPCYPPLGSLEWERRMRRVTAELKQAQAEVFAHCAAINKAVTQIFLDLRRS